MNGEIKYFNSEKGFGFIISEDGKDYFFHISSIHSGITPQKGMRASFIPSKNDKGLTATEIKLTEHPRPFLSINEHEIKKSNIKNYGLSSEHRYYQRVYVMNKEKNQFRGKFDKFISSFLYDEYKYTYTKIKKIYRISQERFNQTSSNQKAYNHVIFAKKGSIIGWEEKYSNGASVVQEIIAPYDGYFDLNNNEFNWNLNDRNEVISDADVMRRLERYLYITTYQGDNYKFYENEFSEPLDQYLQKINSELNQ